jgi:hypothetical protein
MDRVVTDNAFSPISILLLHENAIIFNIGIIPDSDRTKIAITATRPPDSRFAYRITITQAVRLPGRIPPLGNFTVDGLII